MRTPPDRRPALRALAFGVAALIAGALTVVVDRLGAGRFDAIWRFYAAAVLFVAGGAFVYRWTARTAHHLRTPPAVRSRRLTRSRPSREA